MRLAQSSRAVPGSPPALPYLLPPPRSPTKWGRAGDGELEKPLREDPTLGFGAAVAEACRRAALGGGAGAAKADEKGAKASLASYRIVVTTCGTCWAAKRETSEGPVEVDRAELDRAACDSEVLDIREGPKAVTRTIPPKNANFVRARDRGRCRVPGCSNRSFVDIHHEGGRLQVGHDPNKRIARPPA